MLSVTITNLIYRVLVVRQIFVLNVYKLSSILSFREILTVSKYNYALWKIKNIVINTYKRLLFLRTEIKLINALHRKYNYLKCVANTNLKHKIYLLVIIENYYNFVFHFFE